MDAWLETGRPRVSRPWPHGPADESLPGRNGREDRPVGDHLDLVTRELHESGTHRGLGLAVRAGYTVACATGAVNVIDNINANVYSNVYLNVMQTQPGGRKLAKSQAQYPRVVRAAPEPLGWYLRPSYVDDRAIADVVAGRSVGLHGVVFDPLIGASSCRLGEICTRGSRRVVFADTSASRDARLRGSSRMKSQDMEG